MITNYNPNLPYRVIEVVLRNGIFYKITQKEKFCFFWSRYVDVVEYKAYHEPDIIYFKTEKALNEFVDFYLKEKELKKHTVIVFDSLIDKRN